MYTLCADEQFCILLLYVGVVVFFFFFFLLYKCNLTFIETDKTNNVPIVSCYVNLLTKFASDIEHNMKSKIYQTIRTIIKCYR